MWAGTSLAYLLGGATLCMKVCHSEEGPKSTLEGHRMLKSTHLHPASAISAVTAPEALQAGASVPAQPLPDTGSGQAPGLQRGSFCRRPLLAISSCRCALSRQEQWGSACTQPRTSTFKELLGCSFQRVSGMRTHQGSVTKPGKIPTQDKFWKVRHSGS